MNDNKMLIASVVLGVAVVVAAALIVGRSNVNVSVSPAGAPNVTVSPQGTPIVVSGEQTFGAATTDPTVFTEGKFTNLDVTGNAEVGALSLSTLALSGAATGGYLVHVSQEPIVSVTTTQKICSFVNTGTEPRRVIDIGAKFEKNGSGAMRLSITSNFNGSAATGTAGTDLLKDVSWTLSAASSTFNGASSTAGFTTAHERVGGGILSTWDPGESLVYVVASPSSTAGSLPYAGTCYATWMSF
jgi:hypothetical protein